MLAAVVVGGVNEFSLLYSQEFTFEILYHKVPLTNNLFTIRDFFFKFIEILRYNKIVI